MPQNENAPVDENIDASAANVDENNSSNTPNAEGEGEKVNFTEGAPADKDNKSKEPEGKKKNETVTKTKAFSERLKKERERIQIESNAKMKKDMDSIAVARGFKDWEELEAQANKETLEGSGINNPEAFDAYMTEKISKNPVVVEAQKIIDAQRAKDKEEIMKSAIAEINAIDPDIKSADDLTHLDNYDELLVKMKQGNTLVDAYKLVAFDKINSNKVNNATEDVIANIDSKSHMKGISGNKSDHVVVPDDIMAMYRKNIPGMTDDEIRKDYAKHMEGGK